MSIHPINFMGNNDIAVIYKMRNMNNLTTYCNYQNNQKLINYKLLKTGGNDPTMSKAMRYSKYVNNASGQRVFYPQYVEALMNSINPPTNNVNSSSYKGATC